MAEIEFYFTSEQHNDPFTVKADGKVHPATNNAGVWALTVNAGLLGLNVSGQFLVTVDTARKEVVFQARGFAAGDSGGSAKLLPRRSGPF